LVGRASASCVGGLGVWLGLYCSLVRERVAQKRKDPSAYEVYTVDVLRKTSPLEIAIWIVARHGGLERAAARDVKVGVGHERRPSGLHVQLAAQLIVLTMELRVFLFELADAQGWWWERSYLFWREREGCLELRHGLLELQIKYNRFRQ
jgi:hypothetical protein